MQVLLVNNNFYHRGGDTAVFFSTADLLKEKGHRVSFFSTHSAENLDSTYSNYFVSHVDVNTNGILLEPLRVAGRVLYSLEAKKCISRLIDEETPDIAHLHNIYHQLSPSIIDALKKRGVPVVMTLHDYKLVCPTYSMLSRGELCEKCKEGRYYHSFLRRCTKGSALKSLLNTIEMYVHHKILHIYDKIDLFISPSRFLMDKIKEMGFNGNIVHLPNFVNTAEYHPSYESSENSIVYFGRLSREKGVETLIEAVRGIDVRLKIIGDGPQRGELERKVAGEGYGNIRFLGFKRGRELHDEIRKSILSVTPSQCYENNPLSVIEAFALGKAVVGARVGGIPELVRDGETGVTFETGNTDGLREKILALLDDKNKVALMGMKARTFVEDQLTPEKYYDALIDVYQEAMKVCEVRR